MTNSTEPATDADSGAETIVVNILPQTVPPLQDEEPRRAAVRTLRMHDDLYKEIYTLQHGLAPVERKNQHQLLGLTITEAEQWRDHLKERREIVQNERDAKLQATISEVVVKELDARMNSLNGSDQKLESAFAESLATVKAGLEVQAKKAEDLQMEADRLKEENAQLRSRADALKKDAAAETQPVRVVDDRFIDREPNEAWGEWLHKRAFALLALLACVLVMGLLLLAAGKYIPMLMNRQENVANSADSRPNVISRGERLDYDPGVRKMREIARRQKQILDRKGY